MSHLAPSDRTCTSASARIDRDMAGIYLDMVEREILEDTSPKPSRKMRETVLTASRPVDSKLHLLLHLV